LDFINLPGSHTGKNIAICFEKVIDEFFIKPILNTVTTDNATNNDVFIETILADGYLRSPEHHIRCFGHVINLAAQTAIDECRDEFETLRANLKKVSFILLFTFLC
jgi:hypothetical protein